MGPLVTIGAGLLAVFLVIVGQLIFPFAFDFITTLAVYALGVFMGTRAKPAT